MIHISHHAAWQTTWPRALGLLAFVLLLSGPLQGVGDAQTVQATDGDWEIWLDIDTPYAGGSSGLDTWEYSSPPLPDLDNLYVEWFWFRANGPDYNDREYRLESLTLNAASNTNPATNLAEANSIFVDYGGGSDPIRVQAQFQLSGSSGDVTVPWSMIRETITITNTSLGPLQLDWYAYTDLDLDFFIGDDVAQNFGGNSIRQASSYGSDVTVRVASGPNPSSFDISRYSTILQSLDDTLVTEPLDGNTSFGPGDVTHAFHWNLNLGTLPSNNSQTIVLEKEGTFAKFQLPNNAGDEFEFVVDFPPPNGNPVWFDPEFAIGYEYEITSGDNAFAEVYLLDGYTDGEYELEILDPNHDQYGLRIPVSGDGQNVSFDFTANDAQGDGVVAFRILGIEVEAQIDPTNVLGFPTGLTFVNANPLTFVQRPIGSLTADFDDDGDVDGDDFLVWQAGFHLDDRGDADGDGDTDGDDFLLWQSEFGSASGSSSASVPEPACCFLLVTWMAACLLGRIFRPSSVTLAV